MWTTHAPAAGSRLACSQLPPRPAPDDPLTGQIAIGRIATERRS
jgi:hypothetical protein